jgi:sulfoxide reductase heme-binding subunit YedZ
VAGENLLSRKRWLTAFLIAGMPFGYLLIRGFTGTIGPNPVTQVLHFMGDWTLSLLLLALFLASLQKIGRVRSIGQYHQPVGRAAFMFACMHVSIYLVFDQSLNPQFILDDVIEHKRIIVGALAFLILAEQVVSSLVKYRKRIEFSKWIKLHRVIYLAALAGVIHYLWLVKKDVQRPLYFAAVFLGIMVWRWVVWWRLQRLTA